jgi:ubiquinone/menaquinone biosynthesis C-methylase UbiE
VIRYARKSEIRRYLHEGAWGASLAEDSTRGWEYPFVLENLKPRKGLRVLDAGCGRSEIGVHCVQRGCRVSGSDISVAEAESAEGIDAKMPVRHGVGIDYRIEDIRAMSWPDRSFDAVICVSVLEHLEVMPPRFEAIDEMARVLDWGGVLIATVDLYPRDEWYRALLTHNPSLRLLDRRAVPRPVDEVFSDPDTHIDRVHGWGGSRFTSVGFVLKKICPVGTLLRTRARAGRVPAHECRFCEYTMVPRALLPSPCRTPLYPDPAAESCERRS